MTLYDVNQLHRAANYAGVQISIVIVFLAVPFPILTFLLFLYLKRRLC